LANESGWRVATATLSGVGNSTGTFSLSRWRGDLAAVLDHLATPDTRLSLAGFGFGGSLALLAAADDERVTGVATFAAPAHLDRWAGGAETFHGAVAHAGVVGDPAQLLSPAALHHDVTSAKPLRAISALPPRRLMIVHGADDVEVDETEAREFVAAADGRAELRIIQGCGHQMRADPRMVATLLGWLDRHR
jgi:pimeloyl-ACP methyl ester carboxylesterase